MADTPTEITGTALRKVAGKSYIVVNLDKLLPKVRVTIRGLAGTLQIDEDAIFQDLLSLKPNQHVLRFIYGNEGKVKPFPGIRAARIELKGRGQVLSVTQDGRGRFVSAKVYSGFELPSTRALVLRTSKGFLDLLAAAAERRKREARVRAVTPNFDALNKQVVDLHKAIDQLDLSIFLFDNAIKPMGAEVGLLETADALIGLVLARPKSPLSTTDASDLRALRLLLDRLRDQARQDMLLNPPPAIVGTSLTDRDTRSRVVLDLVRAADFVNNVTVLSKNADVAPRGLTADVCEVLMRAYRTLLTTPRSSDAEADVMAALALLASKPFDTKGLPATTNPAFDLELKNIPAPSSVSGALLAMVQLVVGSGPSVVGNMPGPAELCAGIVEMAGFLVLPRVMQDPVNAGKFGARLYRALVISADLDGNNGLARRVELLEAVQEGDLSKIRNISWASRFMGSQGWARGLAGANIIALYFAITGDDDNTTRKILNIAASASGSAVALSMVQYGSFVSLASRGIIFSTSTKVLGTVGAFAGVISGYITAREELEAGDTTGGMIAVAGAVGSSLSLGGFLVAAGASSSATVVGAPIGTVLMVIGTTLIVGSAIAGAIRALTTAGSQGVWLAIVDRFNRPGGPFQIVAASRPALQTAFDNVFAARQSADFADVAFANANDLQDLGFDVDAIAAIVNESQPTVTRQLALGVRP